MVVLPTSILIRKKQIGVGRKSNITPFVILKVASNHIPLTLDKLDKLKILIKSNLKKTVLNQDEKTYINCLKDVNTYRWIFLC